MAFPNFAYSKEKAIALAELWRRQNPEVAAVWSEFRNATRLCWIARAEIHLAGSCLEYEARYTKHYLMRLAVSEMLYRDMVTE